jgi:integrase
MTASALRVFQPHASALIPATPPPESEPGKTVKQVLAWYAQSSSAQRLKLAGEARRLWAKFAAEELDGGGTIGDQLVGRCKRWQLMAFLDKHAGHLANHTRRRWNATIQVPFNKAKELDFIDSNPFHGLKMPRGKKGRDWSEAELRAVLRHTRNAAFRRYLVAIRISGMRPGEVATLEWRHLKDDGGAWKIVFAAEEHKSGGVTGEARALPVNRQMLKLFEWARRNNPAGSKRVFLNSHGTPWLTRAWTKAMSASRDRAGLSKAVKCHGGRHTFITQSQLAGVGLATVSQLVGHRSITTTAEGYTHLDDKVAHLIDAMEQAVTRKPARKKAPPIAKPAEPACPLFEALD